MSKRILVLAVGSALACLSNGQALINSGTSQFGFNSSTDADISGASVRTGTGGGTNSVFISQGAQNIQFQNWYWYRVNSAVVNGSNFSNTREYALSGLLSKSVSGNNMTLHYGETTDGTVNGGALFAANIGYTITNINGGTLVTADNDLVNSTGSALDISVFNYVDFDLSTTADSATMVGDLGSGAFHVSGANRTAEIRWNNASAFQVGAFSTIRNLLTNDTVDDLNNTGVPFGPGDFSGAVEFHIILQPNEAIAIQTSYFTSPVPEPASLVALGAGAAALLRRRRKA